MHFGRIAHNLHRRQTERTGYETPLTERYVERVEARDMLLGQTEAGHMPKDLQSSARMR